MKRNKTPLILSLCLFVLCLVGTIVFGINMPWNEEKTSVLGTTILSAESQQTGDGFYYSGGTKLAYIDESGNQSEVIDLADAGAERIINIKKIEGSNRFIAFADNMMAYVLEETDAGAELVGSFEYSGLALEVANDGQEFYVCYQVGNYCELRVYETENVSNDFVRRGLLYNYGGKGEGISLTLAKGVRVLDMFVKDDMLYIVHEGGVYKMSKSLKLNNFKFISEEERALVGVISYDKNSYDTVIAENEFDEEALAIYTTGVSGACYREMDDRIYFITNNRTLAYCPLEEIGAEPIGTDLNMYQIPDVVFQENVSAKAKLVYDKAADLAYLYFDITNELVCIDLVKQQVSFKTTGEFEVQDAISSQMGDKLLLLHTDSNSGNAEERFIKIVDIEKQAHGTLFMVMTVICGILTAIALLLTIFMALKTFKAGFGERVRITLKKMWKHKWIYIILVPSLTGLFMFCYYPGLASLGLSLFDYTAEKQSMKWNNFGNYIAIFTDKYALESFKNMIIFLVTDILTALIPPLIFAFFLSFMRSKRYSNITRTLLFIPGVIPGIATMLIWRTGIYGEYGVLNTIIQFFHGEPVKFLTSSSSALTSIIMMGFPFIGSYLIFYGAIMNIADSYIEAAELEGCPLLKRIWSIDIPLIMPQMKYVLIMTLISSAQNFNRVYMTTGGSWNTQIPINVMYNNLVAGEYGMSSAYATILFILMFIPMMTNLKTQKKGME